MIILQGLASCAGSRPRRSIAKGVMTKFFGRAGVSACSTACCSLVLAADAITPSDPTCARAAGAIVGGEEIVAATTAYSSSPDEVRAIALPAVPQAHRTPHTQTQAPPPHTTRHKKPPTLPPCPMPKLANACPSVRMHVRGGPRSRPQCK